MGANLGIAIGNILGTFATVIDIFLSQKTRSCGIDGVFCDKKISITVAKVPKIFPIANLLP